MRNAILLAADHIERNPDVFWFWRAEVPSEVNCGTFACGLGWIGFFAGIKRTNPTEYMIDTVVGALGLSKLSGSGEIEFYDRMNGLSGSRLWQRSASLCAKTLRLYADKYHPVRTDSELVAELIQKVTKELLQDASSSEHSSTHSS